MDDDTGEVRTVTVTQDYRIDVSRLHRIAEQCGANDVVSLDRPTSVTGASTDPPR